MLSLSHVEKMSAERGPRYLVSGTVRRGECVAHYAATAEQAERLHDQFVELGYYQIKVEPPEDSVDLQALGRGRRDAKRIFDEATAILRAGVLRALEAGRSEVEVAAAAGVDRMTVRSWAGK